MDGRTQTKKYATKEIKMIIEMDTRNQKDKYITSYLDSKNIKWIRNKLYSGDVKLLNSTDTIIDLKANVLEIAGNLCNTSEHERVKREIERAREIGCKNFVFLIKDDKIKSVDDLKKWSSPRTKVKGEILVKIMMTMKERYGCRFVFTSRKNAGAKVLELLQETLGE